MRIPKPGRRPFLRRDFLQSGLALVTLPVWAAGCRAGRTELLLRQTNPPPAPLAAATPGTYFERFGVGASLLSRVLGAGLHRGGDFCEVFLQHRVRHWLGVEDAEVTQAYSDVTLGAGVRVLQGDSTGYAYTEDLSEAALLGAARTAAAAATGPARARPLPLVRQSSSGASTLAVPWTDIGVERKLPIVKRTDALMRKLDERVVKATVFLVDDTARVLVANSEGLLAEDDRPATELHVVCTAEHRGGTETGAASRAARLGLDFFTPELLEGIANEAVSDTLLLFDAERSLVGEMPVVLGTGVTGLLLHESMGHGMEADFNRKNTSIYASRLGRRIASEAVTIVDDGTDPRCRGSFEIDDEGTPVQRTVLVERGILRTYLHDRISSKHYRLASTGSGRRESYRFAPQPRMRNTFMMNGPYDPAEVIASVKKGLYVEKLGYGEVNIGAGDFTFYLQHGRRIEDGRLGGYVKDLNLIGSGPDVLGKIDLVANDATLFSGAGWCRKHGQIVHVGFGLPTVRAAGISVGGVRS